MTTKNLRWIAVFVLATLLLSAAPVLAESDALVAAYKKEFAFLEAEKTNLKKLIAQHDAEAQSIITDANNDLGALQGSLIFLSGKGDSLQEQLAAIERESESVYDSLDALQSTISQAASTLASYDVKLPEPEGESEELLRAHLQTVFSSALPVLRQLSQVRTEPGKFFLGNGEKVDGSIIHVGNVAALGFSDQGSGALAPAGDRQFKIWQGKGGQTATALAENKTPETLGLFIFDNKDKAIAEKARETVVDEIQKGGIIGWVIVSLGIGALIMILLRASFLYKANARTGNLVEKVRPLVEQGKFKSALDLCHPSRGATARVLNATIRNLDRDREHLEDIISEAILHETPFLDRFGSSILVFAAVAPLLGLLGTVTGMISTFDVITEFGTGDPKLLSGGISEALVTTELGLIVAIPALLLGNLLSSWSEKIKLGMENAALSITNRSVEHRQTNPITNKKPVEKLEEAPSLG